MRSRYATAFGVSCALHLLLAVLVAGLPRPSLAPVAAPPGKSIAVFVVPPTEDSTFKGLNPVDRSKSQWTVAPGDGAESLRIGGLDIDVGRIRARGLVLFPFLSPGLSLDYFVPPSRDDLRASLENPFAAARRRQAQEKQRPLSIADAEVQSLVDKAWARSHRWAAFEPISRLAAKHSPDTGQLAKLLQFYTDQDALQPYADSSSRDPRLWAQLGLAADHVSFIEFIRRFAVDNPSTRATTELLFLLDRVAEANRESLKVMLDSDPAADLNWTREANRDAYRLINEIRWHFRSELSKRNLRSELDIERYYAKTRRAILNGIVRTSPNGYRANDARFLAGAIDWRLGESTRALQTWREMTPGEDGSYLVAGPQIAAALRRVGSTSEAAALPREIDRILKNDLGRWLMFSQVRLAQFGYRFDTF
jgi:hypothetical protein